VTSGYLVERNGDRSDRAGRFVAHDDPQPGGGWIALQAVLEDQALLTGLTEPILGQ
jgi:hypothetical protein